MNSSGAKYIPTHKYAILISQAAQYERMSCD